MCEETDTTEEMHTILGNQISILPAQYFNQYQSQLFFERHLRYYECYSVKELEMKPPKYAFVPQPTPQFCACTKFISFCVIKYYCLIRGREEFEALNM